MAGAKKEQRSTMSFIGADGQSKPTTNNGGKSPKKTGRSISALQTPSGRRLLTNKAGTTKNETMNAGFGQIAASA